MPRRGAHVVAGLGLLVAALCGCAAYELPSAEDEDQVVLAAELATLRMKLGAGLDEASASARLAAAAGGLVVSPPRAPGRLPLRNRRAYEIRLRVDADVARVDLVSVGGTSPIRHVTQDRQLVREYDAVLRLARRVLALPADPPPAPASPSEPPPKGKPARAKGRGKR